MILDDQCWRMSCDLYITVTVVHSQTANATMRTCHLVPVAWWSCVTVEMEGSAGMWVW